MLVGLQRLGQDAVHGAAQVVDDPDQVPHERHCGVLERVLAFALAAPAQILGLGQRAQQLVPERGDLGLEYGRGIRWCLRLSLSLSLGLSLGLQLRRSCQLGILLGCENFLGAYVFFR